MNQINEYIKRMSEYFNQCFNVSYTPVEPVKLKALERKIGVTTKIVQLSRYDADMLFKKAQDVFYHDKGVFTNKELRDLILVYVRTFTDIKFSQFFISNINFMKSSIFRRAVLVYIVSYDTNQSMELLRNCLATELQNDPEKQITVLCLRNAPYILETDGTKQMAAQFQDGIKVYLQKIAFPNAAGNGKFVTKAITEFFWLDNIRVTQKIKVFHEVCNEAGYEFLIPYIAEPLIFAVHHSENQQFRDQLVQILHKKMGDPRNSSNKQYKWDSVSKEAQDVYLSWLKRIDLQLFFDVIDRTAVDSMWRYRRDFWEKYLDKMYYTRVILAPQAAQIARRIANGKELDYAKLDSSVLNQSLFMFSIGDYVFIEASHTGKLRIWKGVKNSPIPFYSNHSFRPTYSYGIVKRSRACLEEFVHSSPKTYSWQQKVARWIHENI